MSIFDELQDKITGLQNPRNLFGNPPLAVALTNFSTGRLKPHAIDANEEHELSATIRVNYWANQAQRPRAREIAERSLASLLYADVLTKLSVIEHAISDSDGTRALKLCGALRDSLLK